MKIIKDLHTHTTYSHGLGSIEDNVKEAVKQGLEVVGISDHGQGHLGFGIKAGALKSMREEIDLLQEKYPQIRITLGIEANILGRDGGIDVSTEDRRLLDYVLCGYHFGSKPGKWARDLPIHLFNLLNRWTGGFEKKARALNTESVVNCLIKNQIDVLTHPGAKGPLDMLAVARAAEEAGTLLEINNSHGHLTEEELRVCMKTGVNFIIGSDAHTPGDVGKHDKALNRVIRVGLPLERVVNLRGDRP
jgi:putative hydrolase